MLSSNNQLHKHPIQNCILILICENQNFNFQFIKQKLQKQKNTLNPSKFVIEILRRESRQLNVQEITS